MEKIREYLKAFNRSATWDLVEPIFNELMHQDLQVVTADGVLNKAEWGQVIQGLLVRGFEASEIEVGEQQDDVIHYQMTMTMIDGTVLKPASKGTIRDGQLVRIEPIAPEVYSAITQLGSS